VPLTHRRLAHSVTFVNGHLGEGERTTDWRFLADPRHTGVIYMGLGHLPEIVARLRSAGAAPGHPAALIAHATLPGQQIVRGTLADIAAQARARQLEAPALLLIGNVAAFDATAAAAEPASEEFSAARPSAAVGALA
jgi:uroporphyrin-III C-methyltransferase